MIISLKLFIVIVEKSNIPLAIEFIGIPFHNIRECELDVPLKVGVAKAPYFLM